MSFQLKSIAAAVTLLAVAGCQSMAMDNERTLAAAGFQMKIASTAAQTSHVESLPQRKLTRVGFDGDNRYVYADAKYCKCMYVGTEMAYDRYQRIAIKKQVANEELNASMDWGAWGGWGPWY
jgi:hypothetical protein